MQFTIQKLLLNLKVIIKKIRKQWKDINKLIEVLETLANGEELDSKYKNHKLINDKKYIDCFECHISYQYIKLKIINQYYCFSQQVAIQSYLIDKFI